MKIPFCKPYIGEDEISAVVDTLRSGWITTGPKTRQFEQRLSAFLGVGQTVCFGSATAAMEMVLRLFGIGEGDEVITTAYTYAATANIIIHTGATPVLVDVTPNSFSIDPQAVAKAITPRTKAIIPVDFAGWPCDYRALGEVVRAAQSSFVAANDMQSALGHILMLGDCAHSLGSEYYGARYAPQLDFAAFSFHAVKNLTTAEGGCVSFDLQDSVFAEEVVKQLRLLGLHGQSKDALAKYAGGGWEYDILFSGYKCNMTDIQAAIGLAQLEGYEAQLERRAEIYAIYSDAFSESGQFIVPPFKDRACQGSFHIYPLRIKGYDERQRAEFIEKMAQQGVQCNVHFKPLPLFTAYKNLFSVHDFPNAMAMYENEVTLPLYPGLQDEEVHTVIKAAFSSI